MSDGIVEPSTTFLPITPLNGAAPLDARNIRMGENIILARNIKGWQQTELAERAKMNPKTLATIEGGRQRIGMDQILQIADALGVSASVLFQGIQRGTNG